MWFAALTKLLRRTATLTCTWKRVEEQKDVGNGEYDERLQMLNAQSEMSRMGRKFKVLEKHGIRR